MTIEQKAKAYNGFMDKECIALCDKLNSLSDIETTESCCGHCKQPYMIFFNCYNFIRLGKLFRCVNRNYSDGKWRIECCCSDVSPIYGFLLTSKEPFNSNEEMMKSVNSLIENIDYWENPIFDNYFNNGQVSQEVAEKYFPELRESESERIREALKEYFINSFQNNGVAAICGVHIIDILAWLEKQGECHISHDDEIMIEQLTEYFTTGRGLQNTNETVVEWLNDVKEKLEKQGEVVSDNDDIEVEEKGIRKAFNKIEDEKQCKQKPQRMISAEAKEAMYKKPAYTVKPKFKVGDTVTVKPMSCHDKVFKGEPFKIVDIIEDNYVSDDGKTYSISLQDGWELVEQKSAWSEEDERTIHNIDAAIRHEVVFPINELKSMEIWLESLKYRIRPKHEWKRDEKMFQLIEDVIDVYRKTHGSVVGGIYTEELKDFLNCIASKQDWKPSNEQIEILDMVLTNESMDDNIARILRELREQLKKLREE